MLLLYTRASHQSPSLLRIHSYWTNGCSRHSRTGSVVFSSCRVPVTFKDMTSSVNGEKGHFAYFAYGSNLSSIRIHLRNPSAVKVANGKLQGHELFTGLPSNIRKNDWGWAGGVASLRRKDGGEVWGVIWRIDLSQITNLDRQESSYDPVEVEIHVDDGSLMTCRTYIARNLEQLSPSPAYKMTMVDGARENSLPEEYVEKLMAIKDNGDHTTVTKLMKQVEERKEKLMQT